ncbi:hypothetical protein OO7_14844 [Providencia sneebia DSM 19967]|uniref:Uncharacterized protein n=1 Tax=Providencia sneebia DSM 19967 TaxID=1141660 RepID=K8VZB9_9GAMM|nr:hypothetical protein OO7_14844 [Providencia sneebia DSM 19967]
MVEVLMNQIGKMNFSGPPQKKLFEFVLNK